MQNEPYDLINKIPLVLFKWKSTSGGPVEFVTENVERLLGYSKSEIESPDFRFADIVHPDDLNRVVDEVVNNDIRKKDFFAHEYYRLKKSDGEYIYVKDHTQIVRTETGKVDYYLGFVYDVSEIVRTETNLNIEIEKYKSVFENPALSRAIVDTDGVIVNPNDKFAGLLGYKKRRTDRQIYSRYYSS